MTIITKRVGSTVFYRADLSQNLGNSYATYPRFMCELGETFPQPASIIVSIDEGSDFFLLSANFCRQKRIFVFEDTEEYVNIKGMLTMKDNNPRGEFLVERVMNSIIASYVNQLFFDNMTLADVVAMVGEAYTNGVREGKNSLQYQMRSLLGV